MIYTSPLVYMCPLSSAVHLKRPLPQPRNHVEGRLILDVVVGEGAAVLEMLAREDEALLVRGDALPFPNLLLDHVDRVA